MRLGAVRVAPLPAGIAARGTGPLAAAGIAAFEFVDLGLNECIDDRVVGLGLHPVEGARTIAERRGAHVPLHPIEDDEGRSSRVSTARILSGDPVIDLRPVDRTRGPA